MENYLDHALAFTAHCSTEQDIYDLFDTLSSSGALGGWLFSRTPMPGDSRPYFHDGSTMIVVNKSSVAKNCAHSSNVFPHDDNHDHVSANMYITELANAFNDTRLISCSIHKPHII